MKKVLFILIALVAGIFAANPTYQSVDGTYEWYTWARVTVTDTLKGNADSVTIVSKRAFPPGYEYILIPGGAWTGGATDSIDCRIAVQCYLWDTTTVPELIVNVDSIQADAAPAAEAFYLPFGGTLFGGNAAIKLFSFTGNGGVAIVPPVWNIVRRRTVATMKKY